MDIPNENQTQNTPEQTAQNEIENQEINQEEEVLIGPPRIGFAGLVFKTLAAFAGGAVGTVVLFGIFLLAQSLLGGFSVNQPLEEYISPVFIFVIMIMVFLSSTIGNILSTFLLSLTEKDKYQNLASAIYQIFIISIIFFLISVPIYFLTAAINPNYIAIAIGLHILISAQTSALILEVVANYRHSLIGVYGVSFAIPLSAGILFLLSRIFNENPALLLFAALPVIWSSIAFMEALVSIFYGFIARTYDKDFLAVDMAYGEDYGRKVEKEDTKPQKQKVDTSDGADFLRNETQN